MVTELTFSAGYLHRGWQFDLALAAGAKTGYLMTAQKDQVAEGINAAFRDIVKLKSPATWLEAKTGDPILQTEGFGNPLCWDFSSAIHSKPLSP